MSKDEEIEVKAKAASVIAIPAKKTAPATSTAGSSSAQNLTLEMNGVINLKLTFKNGDRNIEVICSEEALVCRMADGTEFRIPTGADSKVRKAS